MTDEVVARRVFAGRAEEREYAIATYGRHVAEVRATVPAERLLEFEVAQGWAPLCAFLEVPEPDEPFPRVNDKGAFNERQATSQPPGDRPAPGGGRNDLSLRWSTHRGGGPPE